MLILWSLQGAAQSNAADAGGPTVVVSGTLEKSSAMTIMGAVCRPLEAGAFTVKGLTHVESRAGLDGKFSTRWRFDAATSPETAVQLSREAVAAAQAKLPASLAVQAELERAPAEPREVVLYLMDNRSLGLDTVGAAAALLVKRLETAGALVKAAASTTATRRLQVVVDREKSAQLGLSPAMVDEALEKFGSLEAEPRRGFEPVVERLSAFKVKDQVPLSAIATFQVVPEPSVLYRVDGRMAVRISGAAPAGKSREEAVARALAVAGDGLKELPAGLAVEGR